MASPFPGMDPYLEQPAFWAAFHSRLIVALADAVAPRILPKYYIEVETRTYSTDSDNELLIGIPDSVVLAAALSTPVVRSTTHPNVTEAPSVALQDRPQRVQLPTGLEIRERYLEVRELGSDAVITVIELLSPVNKRVGKGRVAYEEKRQRVLDSASHFIELDLLRADSPMAMVGANPEWTYRILVSRSEQRPMADLYGFNLQESIPSFPLPLKSEDDEPWIDLQAIFQGVYERAGYQFRLNYQDPVPTPTLNLAAQTWVAAQLDHWQRP